MFCRELAFGTVILVWSNPMYLYRLVVTVVYLETNSREDVLDFLTDGQEAAQFSKNTIHLRALTHHSSWCSFLSSTHI